MLLAFEAVARTGSLCLVDAAGRELAFQALPGEAEAGLVPQLDHLIRAHGRPTALAVAVGPGSFTGLRVAVTAARTLAWIEDLPVHAVDSLAALALAQGDGLWWTLLPLKRDTTFEALFRVADGRCTALSPVHARLDAEVPVLHPLAGTAVAVGPALAAKPGLAERWNPGVRLGGAAGPDARGVALAARGVPAIDWRQVLPAYHQETAPELQRRQRALAAPPPAA